MFFGEEKTREWSNFIFFKIAFFGIYIENINTFTFDAWSFLSVHIWFTPSEGHKDFVNWFF